MVSVKEVIDKLNARAKPGNVEGIARYGMTAECQLGISAPDMRKIAKELGKDHKLALKLWQTRMPEAKIVARALGGSGMLGV